MKNLQELNEKLLLANKELEERNLELLRSNTELTSFNYIASHDLQEPLRKIQLFISRIFDDNDHNLSEKNQAYFYRIQASANRMQVLIDDLLAYSRTNIIDKKFDKVDLNIVVQNVINELAQSQSVEEKNAIVNYTSLPTIQGISFQIKQLFSNLIDNAIKYCEPNRQPIINISSTVVHGKNIVDVNADQQKKYYKISVADNGMGFEEEYAEKIFMLFQRLHHKQAFSGNGIGLSICKKVVENHLGFITVNSKSNQGTTFSIYIPTLI